MGPRPDLGKERAPRPKESRLRPITDASSGSGPKTLVGDDIGYVGAFINCEGNRVGVHARK